VWASPLRESRRYWYPRKIKETGVARAQIRYDDYIAKAFLDANIILECRPLAELPWQEINADGPILALMGIVTLTCFTALY
jgi:hypothetical protein